MIIQIIFLKIQLIQLHNSWTPDEYKKMDKETFLNQNNTLAKLLKKLNEL